MRRSPFRTRAARAPQGEAGSHSSGPGGPRSNDDEEYLEQDEEELEAGGRRKSLIALAVLAVLVVTGLVLFDRLHGVSARKDCLTRLYSTSRSLSRRQRQSQPGRLCIPFRAVRFALSRCPK